MPARPVATEIYERYKDIVFEKSANVQVRRGDPVRLRDWGGVESQRELMGLTDAQIAVDLGLDEDEVTAIRTLVEKERFRFDIHQLIYTLKGSRKGTLPGRRGEDPPVQEQPAEQATPRHNAFLRGRNISYVLSWQARRHESEVALDDGAIELTYAELDRQVARLAGGLAGLGLSRGQTLSYVGDESVASVLLFCAVARLGALFQRVRAAEAELIGCARPAIVASSTGGMIAPAEGAHVISVGDDAVTGSVPFQSLFGAAEIEDTSTARDRFLVLSSQSDPGLHVHSQDALLSNAWFQLAALNIGPGRELHASGESVSPGFSAYLLTLSLQGGARYSVRTGCSTISDQDLHWLEAESLLLAYARPTEAGLRAAAGVELRIDEQGFVEYRSPYRATEQLVDGQLVASDGDPSSWHRTARHGRLNPDNQLVFEP